MNDKHKTVEEILNILTNVKVIFKMQHGVRINKVIDIYKNGTTVYVINTREYHQFKDNQDALIGFVQNYITQNGVEVLMPNDKKPKFSQFKRALDACETHAEDYHLNNNKEKTSEEHLYFLFHGAFVKIGKSKDIEERMSTIKTGLQGIFNVYVIENKGFLESTMHNCFSDFRENREWFRYNYRFSDFVMKYGVKYDIKNSDVKTNHTPPKAKHYTRTNHVIENLKNKNSAALPPDTIKKVSDKWWQCTETQKWIHDDNIHKYLFKKRTSL